MPPSRQNPPGLYFVGFGEVTYHWIRTLIEAGYPRNALSVLYLDNGDRGSVATARAAELDVRLVRSPADVLPNVKIHIHATAPALARRIFDACLPSLAPGQTWVDVNSAGPITKSRMSEDAASQGVDFVDGAIMAPPGSTDIGRPFGSPVRARCVSQRGEMSGRRRHAGHARSVRSIHPARHRQVGEGHQGLGREARLGDELAAIDVHDLSGEEAARLRA